MDADENGKESFGDYIVKSIPAEFDANERKVALFLALFLEGAVDYETVRTDIKGVDLIVMPVLSARRKKGIPFDPNIDIPGPRRYRSERYKCNVVGRWVWLRIRVFSRWTSFMFYRNDVFEDLIKSISHPGFGKLLKLIEGITKAEITEADPGDYNPAVVRSLIDFIMNGKIWAVMDTDIRNVKITIGRAKRCHYGKRLILKVDVPNRSKSFFFSKYGVYEKLMEYVTRESIRKLMKIISYINLEYYNSGKFRRRYGEAEAARLKLAMESLLGYGENAVEIKEEELGRFSGDTLEFDRILGAEKGADNNAASESEGGHGDVR